MDTLLKADIFFFISSIAVIVVTIGILLAVYYVIGAVKKFEDYADRFEKEVREKKEEVEDLANDAKAVVEDIRNSFIYNLFFRKGRKRKK